MALAVYQCRLNFQSHSNCSTLCLIPCTHGDVQACRLEAGSPGETSEQPRPLFTAHTATDLVTATAAAFPDAAAASQNGNAACLTDVPARLPAKASAFQDVPSPVDNTASLHSSTADPGHPLPGVRRAQVCCASSNNDQCWIVATDAGHRGQWNSVSKVAAPVLYQLVCSRKQRHVQQA